MTGGRITTLLCLAGSAALAQQSPVIRTETRVVLVDTIVTDKQGDYVHGLSAKDFHLWEDNKEQTIRSAALEIGAAAETGAAASRPRYMVLFFGGMEDADRIAARQAVSGFIDANAGDDQDNRRIAVVSYQGGLRIGQNFTNNAGRLKDGVNRAISSPAAGDGGSAALDTIRALGELAGNLSVLQGRKTIVFLSGGLPQTSIQRAELTAAIDACNKSDVAVYPVDVRPRSAMGSGTAIRAASQGAAPNDDIMFSSLGAGLQGQKDDAGPGSVPLRGGVTGNPDVQLLFRLAGGTGGFVIPNPGELQRGLQRIGEEQSEYYVLSFTPADSKADSKTGGSCHTLRVKVDRSGTTVRARANYCESRPQDLLAGTLTGQELERRAAASQTGTVAASMQLAYFYASPGVARVHIAMEIPPDALESRTQKGKRTEVDFLGIASTADGGVGARFSDALKLDPGGPRRPLHYEKEFRIVPGRYNFTMAFSSGGESFGKLEAPLTVDPRQAGELALSGLVLSKETHPAAELGLRLAGLAENYRPLVADDVQIVPSGSNRFGKSEAGFFYFEVYAPDPAAVRVGVRVLDPKTGEPKSDSGPITLSVPGDGGAIPAGLRLPIDALAAGAYELEVTAVDSAGKPVKRTVDFEIR